MEKNTYENRCSEWQGEDPVSVGVAAASARKMIEKLYKRKSVITESGICTGIADLDVKTAGLQKGELTVIAGRPSMGKTALALSILEFVSVVSKIPCALFSLDLSKEKVGQRMIASLGEIDPHKLRTGFFSEKDWPKIDDAVAMLSDSPMYIDDTSALTPNELIRKVKKLKSDHNVELVVFDYIQCAAEVSFNGEGDHKITVFSRLLSGLARELDIAVIVLSQLPRVTEEREDHRPRLSDLIEYGDMVNVADNVFLLFREEYYVPTKENRGKAELLMPKHRHGPCGCIQVKFLPECQKFIDARYCEEDNEQI